MIMALWFKSPGMMRRYPFCIRSMGRDIGACILSWGLYAIYVRGTMVIADKKEASIQNTITYPMEPNICPDIPCRNTNGRKTTQVVTVEPKMDCSTMFVPDREALAYPRRPLSSSVSMALKQLSSTTMELSTIMPTPSTRPLMVMIFREKPALVIRIRDTRMDVGMELPTIRDAL